MPPFYKVVIVREVTTTFYPTVDGNVTRTGVSEVWADIISGAGLGVAAAQLAVQMGTTAVSGRWSYLYRYILIFDTSLIPNGATIIKAVLSLRGRNKDDSLGITPDINAYAATPATMTGIVRADYTQIGTTPLSSAIAYADWITTGYNDFVLNSTGRNNISKTGKTAFGFRNANYDVAAIAPSWSDTLASILEAYEEEAGGDLRPKLVVTYQI